MAPLTRDMSPWRMVAYAGATWDWHRLHHDQAYARERGLEAPIVDGQLLGGLLATALQEWLGEDARIRTLEFRFAAPVAVGEVVRCEGEVVERLEDGVRCALRVLVVDADGELVREAIRVAGAEVRGRA